jgi:hypothetical protein
MVAEKRFLIMNPISPINQALIGFFQGNAAEIATRFTGFTDSRANIRKWHLPSYARCLEFPAYETQMKAIFHDAFIFDVVMGRALCTAPVAEEAQIITDKRAKYDECSLQAYSVIIRTFTTENSDFCDSSDAVENDGRYWSSLTMVLLTADNIPHLKVVFYDGAQFRQKKERVGGRSAKCQCRSHFQWTRDYGIRKDPNISKRPHSRGYAT